MIALTKKFCSFCNCFYKKKRILQNIMGSVNIKHSSYANTISSRNL